jgi:hypothetical protein
MPEGRQIGREPADNMRTHTTQGFSTQRSCRVARSPRACEQGAFGVGVLRKPVSVTVSNAGKDARQAEIGGVQHNSAIGFRLRNRVEVGQNDGVHAVQQFFAPPAL